MATANSNCWPGTKVPRTFASAFAGAFGGPKVDVHAVFIAPARAPRKTNPLSKTGQLRAILEASGAMTAGELSEASGISNRLISALLRSDIRMGHVIQDLGAKPPRYSLKAGS